MRTYEKLTVPLLPAVPRGAALNGAIEFGWLQRVSLGTLRYRLLRCAGIISRPQYRTTLKLGIPLPRRSGWEQIWAKANAHEKSS